MLPGPAENRYCNKCSGHIKIDTYITMNSMGAKFWTDGKIEGMMYKFTDSLVVCPHCYKPIWINDLEHLVSPTEIMKKESKPYFSPKFNDFMNFLDGNRLSNEDELCVRRDAWLAGNNVRRNKLFEIPLSREEKENLTCLDEMTKLNSLDECILKSEIKRELGFFEQSVKIISIAKEMFKITSDELCFINLIEYLSSIKIPYVRELKQFDEASISLNDQVIDNEVYKSNFGGVNDDKYIHTNKELTLNQRLQRAEEKELALIKVISSNSELSDYFFEKLKILDAEIKEISSSMNNSMTAENKTFQPINLEI